MVYRNENLVFFYQFLEQLKEIRRVKLDEFTYIKRTYNKRAECNRKIKRTDIIGSH